MCDLYEKFCIHYLKTGIKPVKFAYLCSLMKIYLLSNGIKKMDVLKFKDALTFMKYANIDTEYYYVDFRPFKNQTKTYIYIKNCIESIGYTLLHEVTYNNIEYDFAFIYNGWSGPYLYFISIDNNKISYPYTINLSSNNIYETKNIVAKTLSKWLI